jgi:hypothetical protein
MSHKETRDEALAMGDWALGFVVVGMLPMGLLTTEMGQTVDLPRHETPALFRQNMPAP